MSNNTTINNISDNILGAMAIVGESIVNSISFDKTISCTITNDEKREQGEYEVSNGTTKFYAYSSNDNYRKDDVVYVTIPEGNYDNQKIIIGKKTSESLKPITYAEPFDSIFDMTGNIISKDNAKSMSLLANDFPNKLDDNGASSIDISAIGAETASLTFIELKNLSISNYTRLGLKADFKSWVSKAVSGEYGLKLTITAKTTRLIEDNDKENQEIIIDEVLKFKNSEMYGNSYNYETNYTQEIVFKDVEKLGTITGVKIEFYQSGNFLDKNGQLIQSLNDAKTERLADNLFVENIYLCFGYDINTLETDYVEIYTQSPLTYTSSTAESKNNTAEKNLKNINMRWVHRDDEGKLVDMVKKASEDSTAKKYKIYWYKYRIGAAAADEYSGVYWEKLSIPSDFKCEFSPDVNKQQEKVKTIIVFEDNSVYRSNELTFTNQKTVPLDKEASHIMNALQIRVDDGTSGNYLIYGQNNSIKDSSEGDKVRTLSAIFDTNSDGIYESEILSDKLTWTFPTENTMIEPIGQVNYEKITLLEYIPENYYIDVDGEKKQAPEAFNPSFTYYKKIEEDYVEVENDFYQPNVYYKKQYDLASVYNQNEIYYKKENNEYKIANDVSIHNFNQYYILNYIPAVDNYDLSTEYYKYTVITDTAIGRPSYKISKYYSPSKTNNTIVCEYNLNGVLYKSEIQFTFGRAGTMGTDQTLVIDFEGDINAIAIDDPNRNVYKMIIRLYDKSNKELTDISNIEWSWHYKSTDKITLSKANESICELSFSVENMPQHEELYILKVKVDSLETYFPIPLKSNGVSYIEGPSEVIYCSDGTIDYHNVPYKAMGVDNQVIACDWKLIHTELIKFKLEDSHFEEIEESKYEANQYYTKNSEKYTISTVTSAIKDTKYYRLLIDKSIFYIEENENKRLLTNSDILQINSEYYLPNLNYVGELRNNQLKPLGIYVKDAPNYGVKAYFGNIIYWTQPILVLQNRWASNVLNSWDGKTLELNTNEGYILSNAISAGKKNSDNSFSGVIIGDWSKTDTGNEIAGQTGIYGFNKGSMSYAFKEDGTAFIGKAGKGRIEFNGNKGTIQSASWGKNIYPQMLIDLDDSVIEMYGSSSDYIKLDATNKNYPIELGGSLRVNLSNNQKGYIGGLTANQGGIPAGEQAKGFGLRLLEGTSTEIGGFKATSSNTGMYYVGGGYLSISNGALSMGSADLNLYASNSAGATSAKISLDATHVGMWVDGTGYLTFGKSQDSSTGTFKREFIMQTDNSKFVADNSHIGWWQTGSGWMSWYTSQSLGTDINNNNPVPCLVIEGNSEKTTYLKVANIPASQQFGIYARFA